MCVQPQCSHHSRLSICGHSVTVTRVSILRLTTDHMQHRLLWDNNECVLCFTNEQQTRTCMRAHTHTQDYHGMANTANSTDNEAYLDKVNMEKCNTG